MLESPENKWFGYAEGQRGGLLISDPKEVSSRVRDEQLTTFAAGRPPEPQPPPGTVSGLRQALAQIAPAALPAYTRELDQAHTALAQHPR